MTRRSVPLFLCLVAACHGGPVADDPVVDPGPQPAWEAAWTPSAPVFRRLTTAEYRNAVLDVFGVDVLGALEPDVAIIGSYTLGAAETSVSERGVEQYEAAAFGVAESALGDPTTRARVVPCSPTEAADSICLTAVIDKLGRQVWRRPLDQEERVRLLGVGMDAAEVLGTFDDGVSFVIAGLLQSPHFLFREELGEVGDDGVRRYTDWEMASRLSFLLWASTPDAALLDAAAAGELTTDAGLSAQVDRLLDDPRARRFDGRKGAPDEHGGIAAFFEDAYALHDLDSLSKDPLVFEQMSATLGAAAREQTVRDLEHLVFDLDEDFRTILTARWTHLDRELASVYGVPAPARYGFAKTELPADGPRRGLLGQLSFLGAMAHPVSTSPTRRGKFVRERLLCQTVPAPPSNVDTSIPEPSGTTLTMRDRVAEHLTDEYCAGCHRLTDPIGLAFETFDGVGVWRTQDNGATIDASGDLDGAAFPDAWALAGLLEESERVPTCLVQQLFTYATGRLPDAEADADEEALAYLGETFAWGGYRVRHLVRELVLSPVFRTVNEVDLTEDATDTDGGAP